MSLESFEHSFEVRGRDFINAGRVSTEIKETLKKMGLPAAVIRRVAIASYEAEMNMVMYATRGRISLAVDTRSVQLQVVDQGPGIADIELAMQEGYSTATPEMREMGFGAGMGLPNIKKNADIFTITSDVGHGTRLLITVHQAA